MFIILRSLKKKIILIFQQNIPKFLTGKNEKSVLFYLIFYITLA